MSGEDLLSGLQMAGFSLFSHGGVQTQRAELIVSFLKRSSPPKQSIRGSPCARAYPHLRIWGHLRCVTFPRVVSFNPSRV